MKAEPSSASTLVTPEAPWLGLRAFTEDLRGYFFGRDDDLDDLFERVAQKTLTVLFGQSGWGKTSLIKAALMPRLQYTGFVPVWLRLDHGEEDPPLEDQVLSALRAALDPAIVTLPGPDSPAPLWSLLHDPALGLCLPGAPKVVLILDQFEEIFTLGEATLKRRACSEAFLHALAQVIENRVPGALHPLLEGDEALADRLDYGARPLKVVVALREDFLHRLERWRSHMPSLMDNRLELRLLNGTQALKAVEEPGKLRCLASPHLPPIVSTETAQAIVRFVAGAADDADLRDIEAVPPLLSLLCAELNAQRGESPIIRPEQLGGRAEDILKQFYERCLAPHPPVVREFVERRLLSPEGFRQNATHDTFLYDTAKAGMTADAASTVLTQLLDARLIVSEERDGIHRVELTHDKLTGVVAASRDQREEREQKERAQRELVIARRRARLRLAITAGMVVLTAWALFQRSEVTEALSKEQTALSQQRHTLADADYRIATHLAVSNKVPQAYQHLRKTLAIDPGHSDASILTGHLLSREIGDEQYLPEILHRLPAAEAGSLVIDPQHRFALSHDAHVVFLREPVSWKELHRTGDLGEIRWAHFDEQGERILAFTGDGRLHVISLVAPYPDFVLVTGPGVQSVVLTPDASAGMVILTPAAGAGAVPGTAPLYPRYDPNMGMGPEVAPAPVAPVAATDLLRFVNKAWTTPGATVREAGTLRSAVITPDGGQALLTLSRSPVEGDVARVYATAKGTVEWESAIADAKAATLTLRRDARALIATTGQFLGVDCRSPSREWFFLPLPGDEVPHVSADGLWAAFSHPVTSSDIVLVAYPEGGAPASGSAAADDLSIPGGGRVRAHLTKAVDACFLPDSSAMLAAMGNERPSGPGDYGGQPVDIFVYSLDDPSGSRSDPIAPQQVKGEFSVSRDYSPTKDPVFWPSASMGKAVRVTNGFNLGLIVPEAGTVNWTYFNISNPYLPNNGSSLPQRVENNNTLVFVGGKIVTLVPLVKDDGMSPPLLSSLSLMRDVEPVLQAWLNGGHWITATASHVAGWPLRLPARKLLPVQALLSGPNPRFSAHATVIRQLADACLWRDQDVTTEQGNTCEVDWGLADAAGEWVTFGPIAAVDCTVAGDQLYAVDAHGTVQAWNIQSGKGPVPVPVPAETKVLSLDPHRPRALGSDAGRQLWEGDLTKPQTDSRWARLSQLPVTAGTPEVAVPWDKAGGWLVATRSSSGQAIYWASPSLPEARLLLTPRTRDASSTQTASPEGTEEKQVGLQISPSGRYAVAWNDAGWFSCVTAEGLTTVFERDPNGTDQSYGYIRTLRPRIKRNPGVFDGTETLFGSNVPQSGDVALTFTFNLKTLEFHEGVEIDEAAGACTAPVPPWCRDLLDLLGQKERSELLTREEFARQIGYRESAADFFTAIASPWMMPAPRGEVAPPVSVTGATSHSLQGVEGMKGGQDDDPKNPLWQFSRLAAEVQENQVADARSTLEKIAQLYEARRAAGPLNAFHAACYGQALLLKGRFAEAVTQLQLAEKSFPFHVAFKGTKACGDQLRRDLAYALWLSGHHDEAVHYAQAQKFHDWLWHDADWYGPPQASPVKDLETCFPEILDADTDLREATPQPNTTKPSGPGETAATVPPPSSVADSDGQPASTSHFGRAPSPYVIAPSTPSAQASQVLDTSFRVGSKEEASGLNAAAEVLVKGLNQPEQDQHFATYCLLAKIRTLQGRTTEATDWLAKVQASREGGLRLTRRQQAVLLQAQGKYKEALTLWTNELRSVKRSEEMNDMDSFLTACLVAAEAGDFNKAEEFIHLYSLPVTNAQEPATIAPLMVQFLQLFRGWQAWEAGDEVKAARCWITCDQLSQEQLLEQSTDNTSTGQREADDASAFRGLWLPALAAARATRAPAEALLWYRDYLATNPALAMPGGLDTVLIPPLLEADEALFWLYPPLPREAELRTRLKTLHEKLGDDEKRAFQAAHLRKSGPTEEVQSLLEAASQRWPDSPWIGVQRAQLQAELKNEAGAIESWRRALTFWSQQDKAAAGLVSSADPPPPTYLLRAGRPNLGSLLPLVEAAAKQGNFAPVVALLPLAQDTLPAATRADNLRLGWVMLAIPAGEERRMAKGLFEAVQAELKRKDPNTLNYTLLSERAKVDTGQKLEEILSQSQALGALTSYSALAGYFKGGFETWENKLQTLGIPGFVLPRLKAVWTAAKTAPLPEIIATAPKADLADWLKSFGREADLGTLALTDTAMDSELRIEQLLKLATPEALKLVLPLLQGSQDRELFFKHHLELAQALHMAGQKQACVDALETLLQGQVQALPGSPRTPEDQGRQAIELLATVAGDLGQPTRALPWVAAAPGLWPRSQALGLRAAWLALAGEHFEEALRLFAAVEKHAGSTDDKAACVALCTISQAITAWQMGDKDRAMSGYAAYLAGGVDRALADHKPAEMPARWLPVLAQVRTATTALGAAEIHRRGFGAQKDYAACYRTAYNLWDLGLSLDAMAWARQALLLAPSDKPDDQATANYLLAQFLRLHPTPTGALNLEALSLAEKTAGLMPENVSYQQEWVQDLCLAGKWQDVPAQFARLLGMQECEPSDAVTAFQAAIDAGGLPLAGQLFDAASAVRQSQLLLAWICLHIEEGLYQQALDLVDQHRATLSNAEAALVTAMAKAGLGDLDAAMQAYLTCLTLDADEADHDADADPEQWGRLRHELRARLPSLPVSVLLKAARATTDTKQMTTLIVSMFSLAGWKQIAPVFDDWMSGSMSNAQGTFLATHRASYALSKQSPPDFETAFRVLDHPLWSVPPSAPGQAPEVARWDGSQEGPELNVLLIEAGGLGNARLVHRIGELYQTITNPATDVIDWQRLGFAYEQVGDSKAADEAHEAAVQRFGPRPVLLDQRARVLLNRHQWDAALALLDQSLAQRQLDNVAPGWSYYCVRAAVLWMKQDRQAAQDAYRHAIALFPGFARSGFYVPYVPQKTLNWLPLESTTLEAVRKATVETAPKPEVNKRPGS